MMGVREAVEQAIFVAVGAAALTRERAESIVDDLVRRGQLGEDEGRLTVDHLMERVRQAGGGSAAGLVGKIEGGMQGLLRDFGIAQRDDLADVDQRISDLEHRIRLLEESSGAAPAAPEPDAG
jgi:polyhydroxyalkanoate synthesis regulator phasin